MKKLAVLFVCVLMSVVSLSAATQPETVNYRSIVPVLCEGKIMIALCEVKVIGNEASIYIDERFVAKEEISVEPGEKLTAVQNKNNSFELATFSDEGISMQYKTLKGEIIAEVPYMVLNTNPISTRIEDNELEKVLSSKNIFF